MQNCQKYFDWLLIYGYKKEWLKNKKYFENFSKYNEIIREHNNFAIRRVDVEESKECSDIIQFEEMPSFFLFKNGKKIAKDEMKINEIIQSNLSINKLIQKNCKKISKYFFC